MYRSIVRWVHHYKLNIHLDAIELTNKEKNGIDQLQFAVSSFKIKNSV